MFRLIIAWLFGLLVGLGVEKYNNPSMALQQTLIGSGVSLLIGIGVCYIEIQTNITGIFILIVDAVAAFFSTWGLAYLARKKDPPSTPRSKNFGDY